MNHMLIFLVGLIFLLLGVLVGGALCVRYLRQEIADEIGPKLRRMQSQLDSISAELNLAIATRHAELSAPQQGSPADNCRYPHSLNASRHP